MLLRICLLAFSVLLTCCARPEPVESTLKRPQTVLPVIQNTAPQPPLVPQLIASDSIRIRFEKLQAAEGLTVSVTVQGDSDGETTFVNRSCCGIGSARGFVDEVSVRTSNGSLPVTSGSSGWTVRHEQGVALTITYRLPPSGETTIDSGIRDQVRPIVHDGVFHLIGDTALLLPTGRAESDLVEIEVDAQGVADETHFASSFGPGTVRGMVVPRSQITRAL